jgi:hypothetical protein
MEHVMHSYDFEIHINENRDIVITQTLLERGGTEEIFISPDQVPSLVSALNHALEQMGWRPPSAHDQTSFPPTV